MADFIIPPITTSSPATTAKTVTTPAGTSPVITVTVAPTATIAPTSPTSYIYGSVQNGYVFPYGGTSYTVSSIVRDSYGAITQFSAYSSITGRYTITLSSNPTMFNIVYSNDRSISPATTASPATTVSPATTIVPTTTKTPTATVAPTPPSYFY